MKRRRRNIKEVGGTEIKNHYVYFWRAVSGNRGSGADGGGGSLGLVAFTPSDFVLAANFPSSQPIFLLFGCFISFTNGSNK